MKTALRCFGCETKREGHRGIVVFYDDDDDDDDGKGGWIGSRVGLKLIVHIVHMAMSSGNVVHETRLVHGSDVSVSP